MKKLISWQAALGIILIALSIGTYYIHFLLFRDLHHIFLYLVGDIAFVFLEVFLVTMVLHGVLSSREKQALLKKLNMVIGAFFSEVGIDLLRLFCAFDKSATSLSCKLVVTNEWSDRKFSEVCRKTEKYNSDMDSTKGDLNMLKSLLVDKRQFLLSLLENPNLLEHETFTDLLWAVFHLTEELAQRKTLAKLSEADYQHITGDMKRAYALLVREWLAYMSHLKGNYPYLFSLAMRTNPFDQQASVEIK